MKNIYVLLFALFSVIGNNTVQASSFISEVMYSLSGNDVGKEWIEIVNANKMPLSLTNWFILENEVNHKIKFISGSDIIPAGGIAVICSDALGFFTNHPNFNGNLFQSSFELSNIGETISLCDHNKNIVDTINYSYLIGGNGDGNSLNRVLASFVAMTPTPGINSCFSILAFSQMESNKVVITISELVLDTIQIEFSHDLINWSIADVVSSKENVFNILTPKDASQCFFRIVKN